MPNGGVKVYQSGPVYFRASVPIYIGPSYSHYWLWNVFWAASICCFTATMLTLANFWLGRNSKKVWTTCGRPWSARSLAS